MISPKIAKITEYLPKSFVKFCTEKILDYIIHKYVNLKVEGLENLNDIKYPVIFICNHLSNSDALIINRILKDQDVTFVAGVKLSQNATTNLGINIVKTTPLKPNTADKEGLTKVLNIVKNGGNILIFPEGTRSRSASMIKAKKGLLLIARMTNVPIVPIGICGTEKFLPITENGNMASEKFGYADIKVKIGKAITVPKKEKDEEKLDYEERALNTIMYSISELLPENYRGEYAL